MDKPTALDLLERALRGGWIRLDDLLWAIREVHHRHPDTEPDVVHIIDVLVASGRLAPQVLIRLRATHAGPSQCFPRMQQWTREPGTPETIELPDETGYTDILPEIQDWTRYTNFRLLGRGGMGAVYAAWDPQLQRQVALKFLYAQDPHHVRRFLFEARAQARVDHPNVGKVYEVGEIHGRPYIAMQYIEGHTLRDLAPALTVEQKVRIFIQIAEGLHAAHRIGLIHRDVKPQNILVETLPDGTLHPYIVDFGLAREMTAEGLTHTGIAVGTPEYMAPEQVTGQSTQLDRRTDVYGLGVTMYAVFTGSLPFTGGSAVEVMFHILDTLPPPPRKFNPSMPRDLETIILKCMEKDPNRRYDSARAVAEDLRRFLDGEPVLARRSGIGYRLWKKAQKHRWTFAVTAVASVLSIVLGGLWLHTRWTAAQQARIASELGQRVRVIESMMRYTHLSVPHSIVQDRVRVRQQLRSLSQRILRMGQLARAPGHYALGRGHLALGEYTTARDHLLRAWQSGYRTPSVAYTLGLVYARLYRRYRQAAARLTDPEMRARALAEAERQYKQPALEYLRKARGSGEMPAYVTGLIALYEGRYNAALAAVQTMQGHPSWQYEIELLEGDIHMARGQEYLERGAYAEALRDFTRAGNAYGRALRVGRSDPRVYLAECRRWLALMQLAIAQGQSPHRAFRRVREFCRAVRQMDPGDIQSLLIRAEAGVHVAAYRMFHTDRDPLPLLTRGIQLMQRVVHTHPQETQAYVLLARAWQHHARVWVNRGRNPWSLLKKARDALQTAIRIAPDNVALYDELGGIHATWGRYLAGHGRDPRSPFAQAIQAYQRVLRVYPDLVHVYNSMGIIYGVWSEYALQHGMDPSVFLQRSTEAFTRALQLNPHNARVANNAGLAQFNIGEYQRRTGRDPTSAYRQAADFFEQALRIDPLYHLSYNNAGIVYGALAADAVQHGRDPTAFLARAEYLLKRALRINRNAHAWNNLGLIHKIRGEYLWVRGKSPIVQYQQAIRSFRQAIQMNPRYIHAFNNIAATGILAIQYLLHRNGNPEAWFTISRRAVRVVQDIDPGNILAYRYHGVLLLQEARWRIHGGADPTTAFRRSRDFLNRAYTRDPHDAETCREIAVWVVTFVRWQTERRAPLSEEHVMQLIREGLEMARKARMIDPRDAESYLLEGILYALRARYTNDTASRTQWQIRARERRERALQLNPYLARRYSEPIRQTAP